MSACLHSWIYLNKRPTYASLLTLHKILFSCLVLNIILSPKMKKGNEATASYKVTRTFFILWLLIYQGFFGIINYLNFSKRNFSEILIKLMIIFNELVCHFFSNISGRKWRILGDQKTKNGCKSLIYNHLKVPRIRFLPSWISISYKFCVSNLCRKF